MIIYSKNIYIDNERKIDGYITVLDGKIEDISPEQPKGTSEIIDYSDFNILPGFIDIHIHGWGTGSFWSEGTLKSINEMQKYLPLTGVTSFLATTGTDSISKIQNCITVAEEAIQDNQIGAEVLGVHLEGPFINKEYKGMQLEEYCLDPSLEVLKEILKVVTLKNTVRMMTIAPELPGTIEVLNYCRNHGIQVSIGHSAATFEDIKRCKDYGINGVIHMFSGMKGFHHRELGVVGSALYFDDLMCEFAKQTGKTVSHEAFDIVYRIKGSKGIYLTTDCVGLAKMGREFYHYLRKETFIPLKDGQVKVINDLGEEYILDSNNYENIKDLELSFIKSVQNLVEKNEVTLFDVVEMCSINPAKYIDVSDKKGKLYKNYDADFIVLDKELNLVNSYCKGIEIRN